MSGTKFDQKKPKLSLIPKMSLLEVSKVMTHGAEKYGEYNWLGGIEYTRLSSACERHLTSWYLGEDTDSESGLPHLAHAIASLMMLLETQMRDKEHKLDSRYKP